MAGGLHPGISQLIGRRDTVRAGGIEGQGGTGLGRIYGTGDVDGTGATGGGRSTAGSAGSGRSRGGIFGRGATAAGLATEANLGNIGLNFKASTGTISVMMMAGIVIGMFAFYWWTRGSQS